MSYIWTAFGALIVGYVWGYFKGSHEEAVWIHNELLKRGVDETLLS